MAKDKDNKIKKTENFFERDIDPKVAERVDKIMNEEPATAGKVDARPVQAPSGPPGGAPLLPTDKLPKNLKEPEPEKPASTRAEEPPAKELETPIIAQDGVDIDDPETEKAVDDITKEEADRMLAIEDAKAELLSEGSAEIDDGGPLRKLKLALANLWSYSAVRLLAIAVLLIAIAAAFIYPDSRYFILNSAGVRASASMAVLDEKTRQPLKDVEVSLGAQTARSDKEGLVHFSGLKLGRADLTVKKPAFAPLLREVTVGWGSNPLGDIDLTAVGSRYSFELVDFLSGKPVTKAEALSGNASAVADKKGLLAVVVENEDGREVEIEIRAEGYRTEKLKMPVGEQKRKLQLVPARKHAFISKRGGTYDLFTIDVDGKNLKKVLPGTGSERGDSISLLNHQSKDVLALVSTRGNAYSKDGTLLSVLTIVDYAGDETFKVSESESIQLVGFIGDKLIYSRQKLDVPLGDPTRYQLLSYDVETGEEKTLAQANYFNDIMAAKGAVYYSPSAADDPKKGGFFKVNPDGSGKQAILSQEAWNFFRASFDKMHVAFSEEWYEYDLNSSGVHKLEGAPADSRSRIYVESPDSSRSLWVDERDGKGVLLLYDLSSGKDRVLRSTGGLRNPVRWLDGDHVVYRISTNNETADYVMSLSGGEAKKIQDVTDTIGLDRYYYY